MKIKFATLVYQAGCANVFSHQGNGSEYGEVKASTRVRLMQSDFRTCEAYAKGLRDAGVKVRSAWCNEAGDCIHSLWKFSDLDQAPSSNQFRPVN